VAGVGRVELSGKQGRKKELLLKELHKDREFFGDVKK